jgi:membrane associated rhomboid family serine protease
MLRPVLPLHPPREPIFNIPAVVVVTIGVLVLLHGIRSVLPDETDIRLLLELAFIPAQWTLAWAPERAAEILAEAAGQGGERETGAGSALAGYVLSQPGLPFWTALTHALLHGSWGHILLNGVWLAAFGTPVARRCGAVRFLALAVASALGGAAAHLFAHPTSVMPMIGASAAVSGMMAAAARFVFSPASDRFRPDEWPVQHVGQPRLSLLGVMKNSRAALFLAIWFATNLVFGIVASPLGVADASIAWEAHIGGFLVGFLIFPLVDRAQPMRVEAT